MKPSFQAVCEAAAARWSIPSLAAGTAARDRTSVAAVGCAPETRFRIASITKPFTALLALALLDLDAPSGIWPADVHVRHLLSHTSGFDGECGDLARFGDGDDALPRLAAELAGQRRLVGVEELWSYANAGYWLAGHLCAERSGGSYEDALARLVIGPLGLETTSFGAADVAGSGPGASRDPYPRARRPSGGLASNVPDLLRFGRALLRSPHLERMAVVHAAFRDRFYGLGLSGERLAGIEVWGHNGSWGGYESTLLLVPAHGAVFAGLTSSGRGRQALRDVEDAWLEDVAGSRRPTYATVPLAPRVLDELSGTYENAAGETTVERDPAGGLVVTFDDGPYPARAIGETVFEITDGDRVRDRFDFPRPGLARFGSSLSERVA